MYPSNNGDAGADDLRDRETTIRKRILSAKIPQHQENAASECKSHRGTIVLQMNRFRSPALA